MFALSSGSFFTLFQNKVTGGLATSRRDTETQCTNRRKGDKKYDAGIAPARIAGVATVVVVVMVMKSFVANAEMWSTTTTATTTAGLVVDAAIVVGGGTAAIVGDTDAIVGDTAAISHGLCSSALGSIHHMRDSSAMLLSLGPNTVCINHRLQLSVLSVVLL